MEEQLNRFLELVLEAMQNIQNEYLQTVYTNIHFQQPPQGRNVFHENGVLYRFGERVYCYELYHHLRNLLDIERAHNPDFLPGCLLQGEIKKLQILELLNHFNVEHLGGNYTPDFLMHTPGGMDINAYIMEVKVTSRILLEEVTVDLTKILRFMERFNYRKGIFVGINTSLEEISALLNNDHRNEAIKMTIPQEMASNIFVITKQWQHDEIQCSRLNKIFTNE